MTVDPDNARGSPDGAGDLLPDGQLVLGKGPVGGKAAGLLDATGTLRTQGLSEPGRVPRVLVPRLAVTATDFSTISSGRTALMSRGWQKSLMPGSPPHS